MRLLQLVDNIMTCSLLHLQLLLLLATTSTSSPLLTPPQSLSSQCSPPLNGVQIKDGYEKVREFKVDDIFNELAERFGFDFVVGDSPLELPRAAVGVEDPDAEQIMEGADEDGALLVVGEVGLEHVFYRGRVPSDDGVAVEEVVEGEGGGRGGEDAVGKPLHTTVFVGYEFQVGTNQWLSFRAMVFNLMKKV